MDKDYTGNKMQDNIGDKIQSCNKESKQEERNSTIKPTSFKTYKTFVISYLIQKINEVDEKDKQILEELLQKAKNLKTTNMPQFLFKVYDAQKKTGVNLKPLIPRTEEIPKILEDEEK
jgi:hypothetical protein